MKRMIRWGVFKHMTKFTYLLKTMKKRDRMVRWDGVRTISRFHEQPEDGWRGWDRMIRLVVFKHMTKFTYLLKTDEEGGMGWSDGRYTNMRPNSHTSWRRIKMRDRRVGWVVFKHMTKFTYLLKTHEEDGIRWLIRWTSERKWSSWRTVWRRMKRMG